MTAQATIDVQFKPFRLSLIRGNDGQWVASLYRIGDEGAAIVVGYSSLNAQADGARITLSSGTPRLAVGTAMFSLPPKQLQRVRDWIDQQNAPALPDTGAGAP